MPRMDSSALLDDPDGRNRAPTSPASSVSESPHSVALFAAPAGGSCGLSLVLMSDPCSDAANDLPLPLRAAIRAKTVV